MIIFNIFILSQYHNICSHQFNIQILLPMYIIKLSKLMRFHSTPKRKYNKVNQQKKFHLLSLIYKDSIPIRQAADIAKINFLTAKTIVFFYKKHHPSYHFDLLQKVHTYVDTHQPTASYAYIRKNTNTTTEKLIKPLTKIQVICSIGNVLNPQRIGRSYWQSNESISNNKATNNNQGHVLTSVDHFQNKQNFQNREKHLKQNYKRDYESSQRRSSQLQNQNEDIKVIQQKQSEQLLH